MHLFYVSQCADVVLHDALINGHMGSHHRLVWFLKCQLLDYNSLVLHGLFKKKKIFEFIGRKNSYTSWAP